MGTSFSQTLHQDGNGVKIVSIAQTRNSVEEWITPIALWELDADTGLYLPPGESANPKAPRFALNGRTKAVASQLAQAINIPPGAQANIDVSDIGDVSRGQVWIDCNQSYDIGIYTSPGANLIPTPLLETIAAAQPATPTDRPRRHEIPSSYFPTVSIRLAIVNKSSTNSAVLNLWVMWQKTA